MKMIKKNLDTLKSMGLRIIFKKHIQGRRKEMEDLGEAIVGEGILKKTS